MLILLIFMVCMLLYYSFENTFNLGLKVIIRD